MESRVTMPSAMQKLCTLRRIVDISEAILVEDSIYPKEALSLIAVKEQLGKDAESYDYIMAVLLVLLAESGFHVLTSSEKCTNTFSKLWTRLIGEQSSYTTDNLQCVQNTRVVRIPKNWKSEGVYKIYLTLYKSLDVQAKLIAIPMGDKLIINMFPYPKRKKTYSMIVRCLGFVRLGQYVNLKSLSHRFKNGLATPTRTDILNTLKLRNASLQGLPLELQIAIINMLDISSLENLATCTDKFSELCSEVLFRRGTYVTAAVKRQNAEIYIITWFPGIKLRRNLETKIHKNYQNSPFSCLRSLLRKAILSPRKETPQLKWPVIRSGTFQAHSDKCRAMENNTYVAYDEEIIAETNKVEIKDIIQRIPRRPLSPYKPFLSVSIMKKESYYY